MLFGRFLFLTLLLGFTAFAQTPLPECRYDDLSTPHQSYDDWQLTLLDTLYKLDESYAPPDLETITAVATDKQVRGLVMNDLNTLFEDAAANGTPLELQSAYRSYAYQDQTFAYWTEQEGYDAALKSSARAGHSEHQLGTVLDFRSAGGPAPWDLEAWATTPAGAWLAENAWRYGFVMSYPKGSGAETCYIYEPWHYRYMGREAAQSIAESGLTLRAWLWERQ